MKTKYRSFFAILVFLIVVQAVSAFGISYPHPQNIQLLPGESSYFTFQVQTDDFSVICVPFIEETQDLEFAFQQQYEVPASSRFNIKPQIIVPKDTPFGNYKITFCMECTPTEEVDGSRIIPRVCNLPVTANVVSERTRANLLEPTPTTPFWIWITLLIVIIILLVVIILSLVKRRKVLRKK